MDAKGTVLCLTMVCLLVGGIACSKKSMQSTGGMSKATPGQVRAASGSNAPNSMDPSPFERDTAGLYDANAEQASPGTFVAKVDPAAQQRQLEELRSEQAATEAAGLRDVFFGYDSWAITEEGRQILSRDADWLRRNVATVVKVEGHCDERGSSAYNMVLAEKRAKSVRNYLIELGVKPNRLTVISYGKERPFCSEHSEQCYQQNRRGHLVVKTARH